MRTHLFPLVAVAFVAASLAACSGSSTTPTATTPTTPPTNEVLTGTVAAPIGGALQTAFNSFTVTAGNGTLTLTLTSAVETFPDGTLLPTVTMGMGLGTFANGTCTLMANAFTTAQAGSSPQLNGTIAAGAYCVQMSDVTNQLGPVAYAVAVSHY